MLVYTAHKRTAQNPQWTQFQWRTLQFNPHKVLLGTFAAWNFQLLTSLLAMSLGNRFRSSRKGRDKGRWVGAKGCKQYGCVWEWLLL